MSFRSLIVACCLCAPGVGLAHSGAPEPLLPQSFNWMHPPHLPGVKGAWVVGDEASAAGYVFRVVLDKGARIGPHTHPDTRHSTVLSGTLYVGFGETEEVARMVAVPAGAAYVAPAGVPHYLRAPDGEVIYQEGGVGPTATVPVRR